MNNRDKFEAAPLDTPIYIIDEYHNIYVGTLFKRYIPFVGGSSNNIYRGDCLEGNSDLFYRNALIDWANLPNNLISYYNKKRFKNMSDVEKNLDAETLSNNAINFSWLFNYLEQKYPNKTASSGYNAITQMFMEYCRALEKIGKK